MVDIQLNAQGKTILAGKSTGTVSSSFWDASDVQKYKKKRKTHTLCLDVDHGYISSIVQSILNN